MATARAPASAANLGPGFDALALALSLHVEVSVEDAPRLEVLCEGEGAGLAEGAEHLAARIAAGVVGHDRLLVTVKSDIPVGRGLGSSAALALAAAAAAGAADPLAVAASADGHADNAAASALGGLVAVSNIDGEPRAARLRLDPELAFVVVVPQRQLATSQARSALPREVAHADAVFNLGRMALLVAALADRSLLTSELAEDRLHQAYRAPLFPEADSLLAGLLQAGALASCWSGAGPSLLAICDRSSAESVRKSAERLLSVANVAGDARLLEADMRGLIVEGQPPAQA